MLLLSMLSPFHMIALRIAYPYESHYIASLVTLMGCSTGKLGLF